MNEMLLVCVLMFVEMANALRPFYVQQQLWYGGAPCSAQHSMKPSKLHGTPYESNEDIPFRLHVFDSSGQRTNFYMPGETYKLVLDGSRPFRALLLQARLSSLGRHLFGNFRAGRFVEDIYWRTYKLKFQVCGTRMNDSVTTSDYIEKNKIEVDWHAYAGYGPVQFLCVLVKLQSDVIPCHC